MHVLVLRPEPAASRTAGRLGALGHTAVLLPLSKAEHDPDAIKAALAEAHTAIAITSAEMTRALEKLGGDLDRHLATPLFAVGKASADAARRIGFRYVSSANGDGRDLANLIANHRRSAHFPEGPLLYLAGNPRASSFEKRLQDAGVPFRTAEGYRMAPIDPGPRAIERALLRPVPDAALFYSRESARAFFRLAPLVEAPSRFVSMRMLCISPNVAAAVPAAFAGQTAIAASPDEKNLLTLL